jgi:gamma-glutamylcyclotransferase (GGCT)/AIG2-like uncharacterized protein YtfP
MEAEAQAGALRARDTLPDPGSTERYFAYGTLQQGFPNWYDLAEQLGDPLGRFRTVAPHALVIPNQSGCGNPRCGFLHRMAAMVPGVKGFHVEGDLYAISPDAITAIDRLEDYDERRDPPGCYVRTRVEVIGLGGGAVQSAFAYCVHDPASWLALVAGGHAKLMPRYGRELAAVERKACCASNPGHAGRHEVRDPFAPLRAPGGRWIRPPLP